MQNVRVTIEVKKSTTNPTNVFFMNENELDKLEGEIAEMPDVKITKIELIHSWSAAEVVKDIEAQF